MAVVDSVHSPAEVKRSDTDSDQSIDPKVDHFAIDGASLPPQ